MGAFKTALIVLIPVVGLLASYLPPKLEFMGVGRVVVPFNNGNCLKVEGLEACEDAWIHQETGLAYLACSSLAARELWMPPILHLTPPHASIPRDFIAVYDFNSNSYSRLNLINAPQLYLHGMNVHIHAEDPTKLSFFFVNHVPTTQGEGAASVVEIFEGRVGGKDLLWKQTVKHEVIRTPNSIAVVGPRQFYFSNDHKWKVHWLRALEVLYPVASDLGYCDASDAANPNCIVAADGIVYPNGMAKGSGDTIYSASTMTGVVSVWEPQADHTLLVIDEIKTARPLDNIRVNSAGELFLTAFPKIFEVINSHKPEGLAQNATASTEIWRVSRETSEKQYYGSKYRLERVFADDGKVVSGITTGAPYGKNKLLLTGLMSKEVVICTLE